MITIHTNPTINRPQLARLFADGFIDDPVWTAIMPTRRLRRHLIQAEINAGLRHVGTGRALDVAYLDDRVAGALERHGLAVDEDLPLVGGMHPVQDVHERGLARAILSQQGVNMPLLDR